MCMYCRQLENINGKPLYMTFSLFCVIVLFKPLSLFRGLFITNKMHVVTMEIRGSVSQTC